MEEKEDYYLLLKGDAKNQQANELYRSICFAQETLHTDKQTDKPEEIEDCFIAKIEQMK